LRLFCLYFKKAAQSCEQLQSGGLTFAFRYATMYMFSTFLNFNIGDRPPIKKQKQKQTVSGRETKTKQKVRFVHTQMDLNHIDGRESAP